MGPFQKYVVLATIIVLLIWVVVLIWLYRKSKNNTTWPPIIGKCPDYWEDNSPTSDGSDCSNPLRLGKDTCHGNKDFTVQPYIGSRGNCEKTKWANNCQLAWGGLTYGYDKNPCLS